MAVLPSASLGCQRVQVLPRLAGALAIPGIYTSWAPSSAFHRVGALQSAPVSPGRTLVLPLNPRGAHTHMSFLSIYPSIRVFSNESALRQGGQSIGATALASVIVGSGRSPGEGIGYPLQYSWASLVAQ